MFYTEENKVKVIKKFITNYYFVYLLFDFVNSVKNIKNIIRI